MAKRGVGAIIGGLCVCIAVLLVVVLSGGGASSDKGNSKDIRGDADSTQVIAKVGDRQITMGEIQKQLIKHYGNEMVNQLIDREAIRIEAREVGITVDDEEINRELKMNSEGYESLEAYFKAMKDQLGLSQEELHDDAYYKLLLERLATRSVTITDEEVTEYMRTHAEEFKARSEYHIQQMILASKEHADKALRELNKGQEFSTLVRDRSIDETTSSTDGDLGWIFENDPFISSPIMTAAKKLKKNEYSGIIPLTNGYAIILLKDKKTEEKEDPAIIREKVKKQLAIQKAPPMKEVVNALRSKHGAQILDGKFLQ
ncbi:peptidyl-prolyl cis-trans isomerase [Paenibacillus sp. N1-5-1-14]|uniref:peptidyl-prolyl cis-trans isomerase n=1 Tax=Paenibacillus radicibacter TaxID=2972488 RepID=UPI0021592507|nr:peptidyl-prolyl cis-trans isomerase [Paenibacillus radicibacter]MCR8645843.1 peptidyl-prolyl cis-trans isomerase [Paenibacillus radicibacter]